MSPTDLKLCSAIMRLLNRFAWSKKLVPLDQPKSASSRGPGCASGQSACKLGGSHFSSPDCKYMWYWDSHRPRQKLAYSLSLKVNMTSANKVVNTFRSGDVWPLVVTRLARHGATTG